MNTAGKQKGNNMNLLIQLKKAAPVFLVALVCFEFVPTIQAVSPPPDGGYAGGNTAEGQSSLFSLTSGGYNTGDGWNSLRTLSGGSFNTGIGAATLFANTAGSNTATGAAALFSNTTGDDNTANGAFALFSNTTGIGNTALGANAGSMIATANNVVCIGAAGEDVSNSCFIGQIFGATSVNGIPVLINSNDRLGTMTSSRRFKEEIKPMERASEVLLALKPVTFRYKKDIDAGGTSQFGLVAEDVEKVNPDLIVRDKEGKPYSVRYEAVNAMLLNEFLKEHRKVNELKATIAQLKADGATQQALISDLKKRLETVVAGLEEQDSRIERVSDRLEL